MGHSHIVQTLSIAELHQRFGKSREIVSRLTPLTIPHNKGKVGGIRFYYARAGRANKESLLIQYSDQILKYKARSPEYPVQDAFYALASVWLDPCVAQEQESP